MADFEKKNILHNPNLPFKPLFWKRYEDDVYCIWQHGIRRAEAFLKFINAAHPRIKWTSEMEENDALPFTDLNIKRVGNKFVTEVYRKPTHTLRFSHWRSNRPKDCQLNNMKGLLYRAENLCDLDQDKQKEKTLITNAFIACDYPVPAVDRMIKNYRPKTEEEKIKQKEEDAKFDKIYLPYVPKISDILRKQLKKENVKVIFTRGRTIGDLICNNKPKIPRERWKNKVYQIPCKDCEKIYIGETSQWFDERESQHKRAVSNKDTTNGIAQHVYETSHIINWEKAELIDSHKYQRNRKIKEAIYINAFAPGNGDFGCLMNQDMGTYIDPIWRACSSTIKQQLKNKPP